MVRKKLPNKETKLTVLITGKEYLEKVRKMHCDCLPVCHCLFID